MVIELHEHEPLTSLHKYNLDRFRRSHSSFRDINLNCDKSWRSDEKWNACSTEWYYPYVSEFDIEGFGTDLHMIVDLVAPGAVELRDVEEDVGHELVQEATHPGMEDGGVLLRKQILQEPQHTEHRRPKRPQFHAATDLHTSGCRGSSRQFLSTAMILIRNCAESDWKECFALPGFSGVCK